MQMRILCSIILVISVSFLADGSVITGTVCDENRNMLTDIGIAVLSQDSTAVTYGFVDKNGYFSIEIDSVKYDRVILKFTGIGYESKYIEVKTKGFIKPIDIELHTRELELNEVVVESREVYQKGDTINFNVSSFKSPGDRKISDVLNRMPGMTVSDDGKVEFNGKRVSSVSVEGLDLAGSRYGQITRGIDADDIYMVQVLQNNQPIKMLRGVVASDQVDINLRLRDCSKEVWSVDADAGIGYLDKNTLTAPVSYGFNVNPMRFSKTSQTLSSVSISDNQYKVQHGDETEQSVRSDEEYLSMLSMMQPISTGISNIESGKQVGFSTKNLKTNWIWGNPNSVVTRLNVGLFSDETAQQSQMDKEYITIADTPTQRLNQDNDISGKKAYVDLNIKDNGQDKFIDFNSESYFEFEKNHIDNVLNGTSYLDSQRYLNVSTNNGFTYRKLNKGKGIFNVNGALSYTRLNNKLTVLYDDKPAQTNYQSYNMMLSTNYMLNILGVKFGCDTRLEYDYRSIASCTGETTSFDENQFKFAIEPGINHTVNKCRLMLSAPVNFVWRRYNDGYSADPLFGASLSLLYNINAMWRASFNSSFSQKKYKLYDVTPFPFYTSFDTQRVGSGKDGKSNNFNTSLYINFNDMVTGYTAYLLATVLRLDKVPLIKSVLKGESCMLETTKERQPLSNILLKGQIAKRLSSINGTVSMTCQYNHTKSSSFSNNEISPNRMQSGSVRVRFSADPVNWLSVDWGGGLSFARQSIKNSDVSFVNKIHTYTADGKTSFICRDFIGTMAVNVMKNSIANAPVLFLCDISLSYKWSKYEVGVRCENLFNNKSYTRRIMSSVINTTYTNILKPRHIKANFTIKF